MHLPINANIGERIRYFRQVANLTQKQLAERCDLSEAAIRNYELGNRIPDRDTLSQIADALEVSYFALANPELNAYNGAVHTLFRLERIYGLHPVEVDGRILLEIEEPSKEKGHTLLEHLISPGVSLNRSLKEWHRMYRKLSKGQISEEEYLLWKAQFQDLSGISIPAPSIASIFKKEKRTRKPKA